MFRTHHTSNAWALATIQNKFGLEGDVWHYTLDGNRESLGISTSLQHLRVVHENDWFSATTSSASRSGRGTISDTSDQQIDASGIGGNWQRLKDMLPNVLLACFVEVAVVCSGKILALLKVLLLLLPLVADLFDGLLSILVDPWFACIRAFDDINAIL